MSAWYAAIILLLCSALLAVVATVRQNSGETKSGRWWVLAIIFLFLSCDEAIALHERSDNWMETDAVTIGQLTWRDWVLPYAVFTGIVALTYLRFLRDLHMRIRALFLIAGATYVGAALGLEVVETWLLQPGRSTLIVGMLVVLEEFLEMSAVILFAYALLTYLAEYLPIRVDVAEAEWSIDWRGMAVPNMVPGEGVVATQHEQHALGRWETAEQDTSSIRDAPRSASSQH